MELEAKIGARLQAFRLARSIELEYAAEIAHLDVKKYAACEIGEHRMSARALYRLCTLYKTSMTALFID